MSLKRVLALTLLSATALAQSQHPRDHEIPDADTRAWWHTTEDLSSDAMQGRDTGSAAYERAAQYVADRFAQLHLTPAGDNGTWFQRVPLHEIQVAKSGTTFTLLRDGKDTLPLEFLHQISIAASPTLPPTLEAPLVFRGYCSPAEMADTKGKIAVCFGTRRTGMTSARQRQQAALAAGAVALINVDDTAFTLEPPRWPDAYSRSVTFANAPAAPASIPTMRLAAASFAALISGSQQDAAAILKLGGASQPLPTFEIPARLRVTTATTQRDISSPNILAVLPGSDPVLKNEYVVLSAHLDGYGFGEPVLGDSLYNGTLDDAAYVALLLQFIADQKAPLKRSILLCVFTGEEKGLLGASWFTHHLTLPKESLIADINLDQLRPLFPLHILTASAVDDTTLGATARAVAAPMHIEIRPDREPERGLLTRSDNWHFLQIGVPAISFIFGFDPNTDAERRYREWYNYGYHRPQDDLKQPMDFAAARTFNTFFYNLARTVANAAERPTWSPASPLKPKP
ncbi:M28 family peptidase [Granulicella sp. WH15]|uniref:M28 family peptidase n=1 Tax=Granulicella sp. WH15 TaxID=2602070 RepID=UPI0013675158|nr:M28 family peptidase [Granulicella sp. WH15]QHN03727.1 M28 family peptidase [Granulicella sp. WH15]